MYLCIYVSVSTATAAAAATCVVRQSCEWEADVFGLVEPNVLLFAF